MPNGFDVRANIADSFFDRQHVLQQIGRENARKLSKAGAYIRQRARSSLQRTGGGSRLPVGRDSRGRFKSNGRRRAAPGSPPLVHSRDSYATLKNILFSLDSDWESVVVGPVGIGSKRLRGASAQTVPELMERGGTAPVKGKRRRYAKHPFMGPALEKEVAAGTIGAIWASRG